MVLKGAQRAQWLSGRVLDWRPRGRRIKPHWCHCIVSFIKTHLSLLSTGSTQEDLSRHNWKIVDWDIKIQIKQTKYVTQIVTDQRYATTTDWRHIPQENTNWCFYEFSNIYEAVHEISNNVVCATSKGSDQPAHTLSLIRAFASCLNILWVLSYWLNIIWSF